MLFPDPGRFGGLPEAGFDLFVLPDREERRAAILRTIHPALEDLGEDLVRRLDPAAAKPLHAHLPRLDWPKGYQPFCTWLALSFRSQGYQAGPQLNVGVHRDHVAVRLGWDTGAAGFGRFEFLCRLGHLDELLRAVVAKLDLRIRVFAAAPWPDGSTCVFESDSDLAGSFEEVRRRGVWWEVGRRYEWPGDRDCITSPALGEEAARVLAGLLPVYERGEAS